ncbi:MAG TPA: nitrilotriacetate monooxygenase, partial [Beijerinckiaceae bacterium]|nr:nitrilotriacetate monooxygenase [Beijerinckiaceae bacterium]
MAGQKKIKLAAFSHPPGVHAAGWRLPEADNGVDTDFAYYVALAQLAERGKMDMVFFQDSNAVNQSAAIGRRSPARAQYSRCVTIEPLMLLPA